MVVQVVADGTAVLDVTQTEVLMTIMVVAVVLDMY